MYLLKLIVMTFILMMNSQLFASTETVSYSLLNSQNQGTNIPFTDPAWSVSGSFTETIQYNFVSGYKHVYDWQISSFDLFVYNGATLVAPFISSNNVGSYAADFVNGGVSALDFYAIGTGGGHLVLNFVNPIHTLPVYDPILSGYYQTMTVLKTIGSDVGAVVVPEPESYSLMVAGLLGLYMRYLKSRKVAPMLILTESGFTQVY